MDADKMDSQNVAILGATGSIGTSALEVIARYPDRFRVWALTAGSNVEKLAQLASVWRPRVAAIADERLEKNLIAALRDRGVDGTAVVSGQAAIAQIAQDSEVDTVIQAVVGAAGVRPSFAAAAAGKRLLLANKESVVCGGELLMQTVARSGATLLPVDSEHNAVFQCLMAASDAQRASATIWLTCSGGPFRSRPELDLTTVTPAMALAHPTWQMGRKISIDSATLMNKGLEVIEAHHLFGVPASRIEVLIHPQSVVHSMVEFADGAVLAQMGAADMKLPIAHCLGYPERIEGGVQRLNLAQVGSLTFEPPDLQRFPQLAYAYEAIAGTGGMSIVLNAANEIGVEAFLAGRIGFTDIAGLCRAMMDTVEAPAPDSVDAIMALDSLTRHKAGLWVKRHAGHAAPSV